MSKKIEMIGRKFHRLTVLKEAERARNGKAMWFCSCECGNKVVVRGDHLRGGRIKSCGCSGSNAYGVSNLNSTTKLSIAILTANLSFMLVLSANAWEMIAPKFVCVSKQTS